MPRAIVSLDFVEQGSPEWLGKREGKYTGSNAYKLLGSIGVHIYALADLASWGGNFWTKRGHLLEDQAIELYEKIKGVKIIRNEEGIKVGIVTNSLFPHCIYSPDGLTEDVLIEVKSFSIPQHLKLVKMIIDIKILAQVHYGMLITGRKVAHLIAYNPNLAKRHIMGDFGGLVDNPHYDPKNALKIIVIKRDVSIANNFKKILGALNVQPATN